ncbi:hypothetical protein DFR70_119149 [Nocardia tenerifensis]|uniref:DoxX-like protein n=1 Tax=Nocardia tenerifensis TaxID=228006 RepID=A0A318JR49_9NOCA|nr:hypothetical protein [Nocardia tenerifensis]PXX56597.1 hypothetical protein DFR70_119149 [Nocardia tenerifensis]
MRTAAWGFACAALLTELAWLLFFDGSLGWITATAVAIVAVHVGTLGRFRVVCVAVRAVLGLLLLGSVADRFGLLGAPGDDGVSWGSFAAFIDYTRTLLPTFVSRLTGGIALAATVVEFVLGAALLIGVRPRVVAAATAGLLATFTLAMWASLGFAAMSAYAVPVLLAGAAMVATGPARRADERTSPTDPRVLPEPA